jgi:hypothetical protein
LLVSAVRALACDTPNDRFRCPSSQSRDGASAQPLSDVFLLAPILKFAALCGDQC